MNTKAALELSVSAIVILIIALVVLGLIIGFAVSKFNEASSQIQITETTPEPTAQDPISLPGGKQTLTLSKQTETLMDMKVYNSGNTPLVIAGGGGGGGSSIACTDIRYTSGGLAYCGSVGCSPITTFDSFCTGTFASAACNQIQRPTSLSVVAVAPGYTADNGAAANSLNEKFAYYCEDIGCGEPINPGDAACSGASASATGLTCSPALTDVDANYVGTTIAVGDSASVPTRITVGGTQETGRYACTLAFGSASKTIFLEIE